MKDFLDSTLLTVIVFLGLLSAMLLYSLMLSDVDEKTYEYGMLRSLGFKKSYLMRMILMQSSAFSVPGIIGGVLVAFITNILFREVIFMYSQNYITYNLTKWSLILGISFGIIMPQVSNYFPIKAAMGKNLRSSLDLNRRQKDEVGVVATKLEDVGMDVN